MRMYDIIAKKRDGGNLSKEEIEFFTKAYINEEIPDYQVAALLVAIYFNGMSVEETVNLTMCMAKSGDTVDLSSIDGIKVDKHSTGGVGDKTTLIISPIVAALGVKVAKMSGRGLGHTGGTIDKLESIPGFRTSIDRNEFFSIVKEAGLSIISQTGNLVPSDKKLYALRDVTATVASIPLIASSIMSKKIAAGSDCILLDVKVGSGAFMKNIDEGIKLASLMVDIGESVGKRTIALITDMDRPLGKAIGNSLEVIEACNTLKGEGPEDLTNMCIELAANMLYLAKFGNLEECRIAAHRVLNDGSAFEKFKQMVKLQGGDVTVIEDNKKFDVAKVSHEVLSKDDGIINSMNTEICGIASMILGAGRETKESSIDYSAGIVLNKNVGDKIKKGEKIATFYSSSIEKCLEAEKLLNMNIHIETEAPKPVPAILARVTRDGVEKF